MSTLRTELEKIYGDYGKLTPRLVVTLARDPAHPLHDKFEWNDDVAGEKYREVQAAELIRSVKVVFRDHEPGAPSVRQYVNVERPSGNTYVPIEEVAQDPFTRELVLRQAEREWKQMLRRYEGLVGFIDMVRSDVAVGE